MSAAHPDPSARAGVHPGAHHSTARRVALLVTRLAASLCCGIVFGAGLALAGMTHPQKVLAFLDMAGRWDASLLFVLGAAVVIATLAFRVILRRRAPLLDTRFDLPTATAVDARLLTGAALFGIGWGISGYCPGPAIALLAAPNREALYFLPALFAGWGLYRLLEHFWRKT